MHNGKSLPSEVGHGGTNLHNLGIDSVWVNTIHVGFEIMVQKLQNKADLFGSENNFFQPADKST